MTVARQRLGRQAEELVVRELERRSWRVLERNARIAGIRGELDIVALDGRELVFVEVKSGRVGARAGPATPLEMVGHRKRVKLRALAAGWVRQHRDELPGLAGLRIDVIALRVDGAGRITDWKHVRAAC